jgi:hypothetical protein
MLAVLCLVGCGASPRAEIRAESTLPTGFKISDISSRITLNFGKQMIDPADEPPSNGSGGCCWFDGERSYDIIIDPFGTPS